MKKLIAIILAMTMVFALAACGEKTPEEVPEEAPEEITPEEPAVAEKETVEEKPRFVFVVPAASVAFWTAVEEGMADAAEYFNVDLDIIGPNEMDVVKQVEFIEAEIANHPDAMSTVCVNENVYDDAIALAVANGIPFVTMDGDAPKVPSDLSLRSAM